MAASKEDAEVLIVGSGIFGASLAVELASGPYKGKADNIVILDRELGGPASDAASSDINKVVRQDYSDKLYSGLAFEAIDEWKCPPWNKYYHETGVLIYAKKSGTGTSFVESSYLNQRSLCVPATRLSSPEAIKSVLPQNVPLASFEDCVGYYSPRGGWANASGAANEMARKAKGLGCRFEQGTAFRLLREGKTVQGVELEDGRMIRARQTVVAAGSWSATLVPELGDKCVGTGQFFATIQLSKEDAERYRSLPIPMNLNNEFYMFPPNEDDIIKFAIHGAGYTNYQRSELDPSVKVSVPHTKRTTGNPREGVPKEAVDKLREALAGLYPELAAMTFTDSRLCWYCDTIDGNFLVGHHPTLHNLFIATGGSGHAFKFLPVLGKYLFQSYEGKMDPETQRLWGLERERREPDPARVGKEEARRELRVDEIVRTEEGYRP